MANNLTQKEHSNILNMLEAGMSTKQIADITHRSQVTVQRVRNWPEFAKYKQGSHQAANKRASKTIQNKIEPNETQIYERRVKYKVEVTVWEYQY